MNTLPNTPSPLRDGAAQAVSNLADKATHTADNAISGTQRFAQDAVDSVASRAKEWSAEAGPALGRAGEQASALAHRGIDAVRHTSQQFREGADEASTRTISYIKEEPLKAMLIAGATGAALMALFSLLGHSRQRN